MDDPRATTLAHFRLIQSSDVWDRVQSCTVPLFAFQDGKWPLLGTAVLLQIADVTFLLSAGHVIDDVLGAMKHGLPVVLTPNAPGTPLIRLLQVQGSSSKAPDSDDRDDDMLDIGFVELTQEVARRLAIHRKFLRVHDLDLRDAQHPGDGYFVFGYPKSLSEANSEQGVLNYKPLVYASHPYQGERGKLVRHNPESEIALHFVPSMSIDDTGNPSGIPHPSGISGCGIWRLMKQGTSIEKWSPDMVKLVGIEHTWNKDIEVFRGTQVRFLVRLIYDRCEHLRPAIRLSGSLPL